MTFLAIIIIAVTVLVFVCFRIISKRQADKKRQTLKSSVEVLKDTIADALDDISKKFIYSHYITESERVEIENKYAGLYQKISKIFGSKYFKEIDGTEQLVRLHTALSDTKGFKETNNARFIEGQLKKNSSYFDTVLNYPLDLQQREAILSLEDNVLVISSAGSGKTMTTVGKVRYLIDKQGVDPKKILLITFTRKAAASLSERLGIEGLRCVTFHKLALDIIGDSTGKKPSITGSDFPVQVYQKLLDSNDDFKQSIADYLLRARYKMRDQFEYASFEEYMNDRKRYGIQAYYKDMDGHPVFCKSDEECQICDFLGARGIKFRYEEPYVVDVQDAKHRQYRPDFSIYFTDKNGEEQHIYLEHFAVNEYGHVPQWFGEGTPQSHKQAEDDYLSSIVWKRNLHRAKKTRLIETKSADFHRGDVFKVLDRQLKECGLPEYSYKYDRESISRELARQEQSILDMLTSFTFLLKSKGMSSDSINSLNVNRKDAVTINQIILPYLNTYQQISRERGEIDFVDAIIIATRLCSQGHCQEYDYILVDEFQDISLDRYYFLQSLRRKKPLTKLFCVGDDWQSIYRFAGSDMTLFKDFQKYFGYTKECRMETTYRFGEPLIQKSSKFILHNPDQKSKSVRPFKSDVNTRLEFVGTSDKSETVDRVIGIINSLPQDSEIYVLGRYSFNVAIFKDSPIAIKNTTSKVTLEYNGRTMTYMTVHQSKGLECDYVILLGCDSGSFGFPADISDPPVLKYVLSKPDGYQFGEERRVFYVGITRGKKVTYVFYNQNNPSVFISEFIALQNKAESIPESERCPKCKCGRVTEVYRGKAVNGNPYTVYVCSNEKYGCDYKETAFINLNRLHSKRRH